MATPVYVGTTQRVSATFHGWDEEGQPAPENPDSIEVRIYNTATSPDTLLGTENPNVGASLGNYFFLWTPSALGDYNIQFYGEFTDGSVAIGNNFFSVYEGELVGSGEVLGTDFELVFATSMEPMYIDPEELTLFFPDTPLVEIMEQAYYASVEASKYLIDGEVTDLMREYVLAATACALSRNYDPTGNMGMGGGMEESVTLGDLTVKSGSTASSRGNSMITRANAATWCELAVVLRKELMRSKTGMKATHKASASGWPSRHKSREIRRTF